MPPATTFCGAVREFSPIELRVGCDEEDACADRGRRSSRTVAEETMRDSGLHIFESRRGFLRSDLDGWQEPCFVRGIDRQLASNCAGQHIGHDVARMALIRD